MKLRRILPLSAALSACLALSACGDRATDYPTLAPTADLLAPPAIPGHAQIAADSPDQVVADLTDAGQALAVSSTELTAAPGADEQLTARAERLRQRAAASARADSALDDRAAQMRARICREAATDPDAARPAYCPPAS